MYILQTYVTASYWSQQVYNSGTYSAWCSGYNTVAGAMKKAWSVVTLSPFFLRPGIPEFSQKFRVANENSSLYFQKCWVLTRKVCLKNGLYQNSRFWKNLKFSLSQILFAASWLQHVYGFRGAGPVGLACPRGEMGIKRNLGLIT